jgi:peptide deformylase
VALLKITTDQEFLKKVSKPVTAFDARLAALLDDMKETMDQAFGAGLAAVQVGVLTRVALVSDKGKAIEIVNPEIIAAHQVKEGEEMCLSFPNFAAMIKRPQIVIVRALDRNGNPFQHRFRGISAVCACHEIDHMNGITIADARGDK